MFLHTGNEFTSFLWIDDPEMLSVDLDNLFVRYGACCAT